MKRLIALPIIAALSLGGCAQYNNFLSAFTDSVVQTNTAIATISQSLYANCTQLQATATSLQALAAVITKDSTTNASFAAANAVLKGFCTSPPNDIPSAVATVAAQVLAAKQAYVAAKRGS